jgi:large subunit ribosomal protein L14e
MTIYDIGRVCVKKSGREAGKRCVVVDVVDKNFVVVTGPRSVTDVKRRRANVDHLEPTNLKVSITKGAEDETVKKALMDAGIVEAIPTVEKEKPKVAKRPAAKKAVKPAPKAKKPAVRRRKGKEEAKSGGAQEAPQVPGGE